MRRLLTLAFVVVALVGPLFAVAAAGATPRQDDESSEGIEGTFLNRDITPPKPVEARGKWVEKCAAAKMRDQATQWASPNPQPSSPAPQSTSFPALPSFLSQPTPAAPAAAGPDVTRNGL